MSKIINSFEWHDHYGGRGYNRGFDHYGGRGQYGGWGHNGGQNWTRNQMWFLPWNMNGWKWSFFKEQFYFCRTCFDITSSSCPALVAVTYTVRWIARRIVLTGADEFTVQTVTSFPTRYSGTKTTFSRLRKPSFLQLCILDALSLASSRNSRSAWYV